MLYSWYAGLTEGRMCSRGFQCAHAVIQGWDASSVASLLLSSVSVSLAGVHSQACQAHLVMVRCPHPPSCATRWFMTWRLTAWLRSRARAEDGLSLGEPCVIRAEGSRLFLLLPASLCGLAREPVGHLVPRSHARGLAAGLAARVPLGVFKGWPDLRNRGSCMRLAWFSACLRWSRVQAVPAEPGIAFGCFEPQHPDVMLEERAVCTERVE